MSYVCTDVTIRIHLVTAITQWHHDYFMHKQSECEQTMLIFCIMQEHSQENLMAPSLVMQEPGQCGIA